MQRIGATVFGLLRGGLSGITRGGGLSGITGGGGGSTLMEKCRGLSTLCVRVPFLAPVNPLSISVRTKTRNHFPRPQETKRIRCHGWKTRMSTKNGRAIIMRRILRGRYVLAH